MATRNIRALLSYDGSDFCGWQSQSSGRTVQDEVESALEKLHDRRVPVRVAGRTDSGVHADGQVINFKSDSSIPAERFVQAMNQHLPPDVRILKSEKVDEDFDARFDARIRVYKYYFRGGAVRDPSRGRYSWFLPAAPDVARLNRYASVLVGSHDFSTFAAAGDTSNSRVREVFSAGFFIEGGQLVFKIAANAFLYRMVRSLVGTMIELERQGFEPDEMRRRLAAAERSECGQTAPPWGLYLHKVIYDTKRAY